LQIAYIGIGGLGLAILGIIGWGFWRESVINQTNAELKTQISRSKKLLASNRKFDALLENLKVGSQLKQTRWVEADTTIQMVAALQQAVEGVREYNTLEKHTGAVNSVSFSPDGQKIVSASDDNTITLWNLQGRELQTLTGHEDKVNSVSFSSDGKMIASGSKDGTIKLWNLQGKEFQFKKQFPENRDKELNQERVKVQDNVYSVSFSPDGQIIASASAWGIVNLWKLQGEKLPSSNEHRPYSVSFSPNGQLLAGVGEDSTVQLWTVQLWDLKNNKIRTLNKHKNKVNSVSFSPDGQRLASASKDGTVKLWNLDGKELETFKGHTDAVNSVSFSPDGQILASASNDSTVKLWNLDGKELETFKGHTDVVNSVSFSPDGQILASASGDKTVKLWRLQLREPQTRQKQENLNLDDLVRRGCDLLKDYLATHPKALKDFPDCQSQPSALP
jgi:WD40 repeat protein